MKKVSSLNSFFIIAFRGYLFIPTVSAVPWVGAGAYCVYDLESGQFLGGDNWRTVPPRPALPIMTALLAEEYLDLEETPLVSEQAARTRQRP